MQLTQAFIFAAGRGERMRPITDSIPKPLVKILGKEILIYSLEKIAKIESINKIIINGFYLAEQIANFVEKQNNPKIIFSHELEKIETGGALVFAQDKIDVSKPMLVVNGDILWQEGSNSQIEKLWQKWLEISKKDQNCEILLGLKPKNQYYGYNGFGDFDLLDNCRVNCLKQQKTHAYVGLAIIDPKILERKPVKNCFSLSYFFKEKLKANGNIDNVRGIELDADFFHIGEVISISKSEEKLKSLLSY